MKKAKGYALLILAVLFFSFPAAGFSEDAVGPAKDADALTAGAETAAVIAQDGSTQKKETPAKDEKDAGEPTRADEVQVPVAEVRN